MNRAGTRPKISPANYTIDEAAERAGVSRQLIYRGVKAGEIPHLKFGPKRIVIPRTAFDKFLDNCGGRNVAA
jgi:excisionase family DNA binding protein